VTAIDGIYRGMREFAKVYGVTIAGGDVVAAKQLTLTIAVLGEASIDEEGRPKLLRRSAARPGDGAIAARSHIALDRAHFRFQAA
jgi:thiamine monophosphate kinase